MNNATPSPEQMLAEIKLMNDFFKSRVTSLREMAEASFHAGNIAQAYEFRGQRIELELVASTVDSLRLRLAMGD